MSGFTAVLDACVLYPAPLRDLLLSLAAEGIYRAKWSQQIHDEWTRNLLANRKDLDPKRLERTCTMINAAVPDSLVTGYNDLIESLELPAPDDRHVLAVAIRSDADSIVTFNHRDFVESELRKCDCGYETLPRPQTHFLKRCNNRGYRKPLPNYQNSQT